MTSTATNNSNPTVLQDPSARQPLGVAIVGCGQIVTHHVKAMAKAVYAATNDGDSSSTKTRLFQIRALVDPSAERRSIIRQLARDVGLLSEEEDATNTTNANTNTSTSTSSAVNEYSALDDLLLLLHNDDTNILTTTIDILFIAVPHDLHESLALQALQQAQGKVVVMEKPLAPTRTACDRLVQASADLLQQSQENRMNKNNAVSMLMVAEQSPYWPAVVHAQKLLSCKNCPIGDTIVTAASYYYESMRDNITSGTTNATNDNNDSKGSILGWRASVARAGGGIALDGGLHWIRPLREMLGLKIHKVVGVVRRNMAPELQMEGESVGHALLQMETTGKEPEGAGPLVATYSCNMLATAPMAHDICPYFRITGNQGELVIHGNGLVCANQPDGYGGGLRLYNDANPNGVELLTPDQLQGGFFRGFTGLWERLYEICITRDYAAAHETVVRAAHDVKTVLALYDSAKSGQWESVEE